MLMGSAGCRSTQRHRKMCSSTFASWKTRTKHRNSHRSSTLPLISAGKRYGSSFATGTILSPVAAFAWKSCRVVPSVRWGAIMATVRRQRGPYSPEGHGIRSRSILWDLYPPTTDRNFSSCLWIATRGIPSSSRLLSDRGREFVGEVWGKLLRSLGIQRVLTSLYHPEGNAINERSHRTLNNMLRARLLEGTSSKAWVKKIPGIMLTLNAMSHEPHGFSASMVVTGREPTLPPDVQEYAHASTSVDDPNDYVEVLTQRLKLMHQQMASPSPPAVANPY